MKQFKKIIYFLVYWGLLLGFVACEEWTEPERVDLSPEREEIRDQAAWERYTWNLRDYKASNHILAYAQMMNNPSVSESERDFLRSLPDSLDIVSLQRKPSKFDLEDMPYMNQLGTRVLYPIFEGDVAQEVHDAVLEHGFKGVVFKADKPFSDLQSVLSQLEGVGLKVYEGDPRRLDASVLEAFDLYVLPTEKIEFLTEFDAFLQQVEQMGIPSNKIIISVTPNTKIRDYRPVMRHDALEYGLHFTLSNHLVGLAIYDIGLDYHHADLNYKIIRQLIAQMNLTPKN